jgi:hypothetical protein
LKDLDIIDLSCNITVDHNNQPAPKDPNARALYIDKLKELVFGEDEVLSSSSSSSSSSHKIEEENVSFFSMLTLNWWSKTTNKKTTNKKTTKKKTTNKKTPKRKNQQSTKKTRREYIRK